MNVADLGFYEVDEQGHMMPQGTLTNVVTSVSDAVVGLVPITACTAP